MAVLAGNLTSVGNPLNWSLLFARQPEPDLEFTEEELDQTTATRPSSSMKPKKSKGGRPLLWVLLLMLLAGVGYLAMEPAQLAEWLAPFLGENAPQPPPVAMRPKPVPPAPAPPAAPAPSPEATPSRNHCSVRNCSGSPLACSSPGNARTGPNRTGHCDGGFSHVWRRPKSHRDRQPGYPC